MKVVVVLALAVFTGCHANLFYADEPKPQLEVLTDAFWDYVAKATNSADDTLRMIRKSQFGQEVNARLTESADMASQYAVTLQERLPPMAQDLLSKITQEAEVLRERLSQDLSTVRGQLEPYTEELKQGVDQRLQNFQNTVTAIAAQVQVELAQRAKQVKQLVAPYAEDLREKLDPYASDFQAQLTSLYQSLVNGN